MTTMLEAKTGAGPDVGRSSWRARARRLGIIAIRVGLDALVLDATWETWHSPSPLRLGLAVTTGLYFVLSAYVLSQGGRIGERGWLTDPATPLVLLLGFLVAASWSPDGLARGVVMLRQPTQVVFAGATAFVILLAAWRLVRPGGVRSRWVRVGLLAVAAYGVWAFVGAIRLHTPYVAVLRGESVWRSLPVALRGAPLCAFGLPVLAFAREFGVWMVQLSLRGLLRWMVILAVGTWVALNAVGS
jgi:hypothetical protein